MEFNVKAEKNSFIVEIAKIKSEKRLEIRYLDLEDTDLRKTNEITSKIKEETAKYFKCDKVELIFSHKAELKVSSIMRDNKKAFESN